MQIQQRSCRTKSIELINIKPTWAKEVKSCDRGIWISIDA